MTQFSKLSPDKDGKPVETDIREMPQSAMQSCPHFIMAPEHYRNKRADYRCRCDDASHTQMESWGYTWDNTTKRWR